MGRHGKGTSTAQILQTLRRASQTTLSEMAELLGTDAGTVALLEDGYFDLTADERRAYRRDPVASPDPTPSSPGLRVILGGKA